MVQDTESRTARPRKKAMRVKPQFIGLAGLMAVMVIGAAAFVGYNSADARKVSSHGNALVVAAASGAGQQAQPATTATVYGFRSAEFGDDEKAIRAAIKKDFGIGKDKILVRDNLATGTRALVIRTENLLPDTGAARIGYIIGYKSKGLTQVNIIWGTPVSAQAKGMQVAKTAVMLKSYFSKLGFDPKRQVADRRLRNGGILVFRATDTKNRLVQIVYREVDAKDRAVANDEKKGDAVSAARATEDETDETATVGDGKGGTKKAYILKLSYVLDPQRPDVMRIEKGAF